MRRFRGLKIAEYLVGESQACIAQRVPSREIPNDPPNCPPSSVLLVLKMKLYTKDLLCTQRDSAGRKLRDQAVGAYCHEGREPLELMECKLVPGKQVGSDR